MDNGHEGQMALDSYVRSGRRTGRLSAGDLRSLSLFGAVPDGPLAMLAHTSSWRLYRRHERIAEIEMQGADLYIVACGMVAIGGAEDGHEFFIFLLSTDDAISLVGLPPAISRVVHAEALTTSVVYRLPRQPFRQIEYDYPDVRRLLARQTNLYLHQAATMLLEYSFYDAQTRFSRVLGRIGARVENGFVPFTHEDLARLSGLSRTQASAFLSRLLERGDVRYRRHRTGVTVLDPEKLALADGSLGETSEI